MKTFPFGKLFCSVFLPALAIGLLGLSVDWSGPEDELEHRVPEIRSRIERIRAEKRDCAPRSYKATDPVGDGLESDCGWPGMPDCLYVPPGCP
jgi:hypothetical protein